ncbi:RHS repeat-associated core domain-containing protein [Agriterribacter sp.]|uniref:RHS repeat domain-containing protein n=1 Tax=Agriterribacter sp. TaxID=2821509 RepID=UPI002CB8A814|nr:RHS repeat-associated core domain-containing protein [Agriterribacter sp.]HRO46818.1 RHS repeat-associated core domain-containing protein [Agriterribacter sp.]HRQ15573.1 RHS repeat-associated core domain-containing protein [Agriterribacter sp.]
MLILGICFLNTVGAVEEPAIIAPLEGYLGQLKPGSFAQVQDMGFYADQERNPHKFEATFTRNIITFSIDEASPFFLRSPFEATIVYRLYYSFKTAPYNEDSLAENQTLTINYDTAKGKSIKTKNSFVFENAVWVRLNIVSVTTSAEGWNPLPSLKITNELQIERVYNFDCDENKVPQIDFNPPLENDAGELDVFWQPAEGADEYDLEWTYIDQPAYDAHVYGSPGTEYFEKNVFKNNAARVTLNHTVHHYPVPLLYNNHGWLIFRVRPVQVKPSGQRTEANWSASNTFECKQGHEDKLNWQASTSFAEEGRRKSVLQYFDGSLRNRQTVTKDNTENTTVVAEAFYDYQGRPVIQVLPAPTISKLIKHTPGFNHFLNTTEYYKDNYDKLLPNRDYCDGAAPALDPEKGGAAQYYSPQNPQKTEGNNKLIPDANGFPYTETKYLQDNTGRIAAQSGVGPYHRLATEHETRYYYGNPDQTELDALFGTEAGDASHYFKHMVRDANGQYKVSYIDMHGRTVATALAGDLPGGMKLERLPSKQDDYITKTLTNVSNNVIKGITIESSKGLLVAKPGNHTFSYSLLPDTVNINNCAGTDICYTCSYTLEITISDDCGNKQFGGNPFVYTGVVGNISDACSNLPALFTRNFDKVLEEGSYTITKKLTIRDEALQTYQAAFDTTDLCKTLQDFVEEQKQVFLNSTNSCATPCLNCQQQLDASQQAFLNRFIADNGLNANLETDRRLATAAYEKLSAQCEELCGGAQQKNYLANLRMMMLRDVTPPYGQYANIEDHTGTADNKQYYINGIFGPISSGNSSCRYTISSLQYKHANGTPATVTILRNGNWVTLTPQQLTIAEFVLNFEPSWAETLADNLHPERMQYAILNTTPVVNNQPAVGSSSYNWDMDFIGTGTFEEAQQKGYLNPTNNIAFTRRYPTLFAGSSVNADPFFKMHPILRNQMQVFMQQVTAAGSYTADIWNAASFAGFCSHEGDEACMQKQITDPFSTQGCTADLDVAWQAFRAIYKSKKDELILAMVKSNTGSAPVIDETKYRSYFSDIYTNIKYGTGINDINNKNEAEAALQNFYQDQSSCNSYAELWWNKLSPCDIHKLLPYKTVLLADLVTVCAKGSDASHPMGASSIAPGVTNTYQNFGEVIAHYVQLYNTANPATPIGVPDCNGSLISFPAAYSMPQVWTGKPVITKPEPCECEKLAQLHHAYTQENNDAGFGAYIERVLHTTVRNGMLDTLLNLCSGAIDCKFISTAVYLPPALQCGTENACVPCTAIKEGFDAFASAYPNAAPRFEESTPEQQNINQLFAYYMNNRFGFAKQAQEYLSFMDSCEVKVLNGCDSLNNLTRSFNKDVNPYRVEAFCHSNELDPPLIKDLNTIVSDGYLHWPKAIRDTTGRNWVYFQHRRAGSSFCLENGYSIEFRFKSLKKVLRPNDDVFYFTDRNTGFVLHRRETDRRGFHLLSINAINPEDERPVNIHSGLILMDEDPDVIYKAWSVIKLEVKAAYISIYYNGRLIKQAARTTMPLRNWPAFTLAFLDYQAALDWIRVYDGNDVPVYFDDFNSTDTRSTVSPSFVCPQPVPDCQAAFIKYYNQQRGTSYTYGQIDSVYFNTCGKHLDVCGNNNLLKDSLIRLADAYKANYNSIDDSGVDTGLPPVYWVTGGYSSYTGLPVSSSNLSVIADTGVLHMPTGSDPLYYSSIGYRNLKGICIENEYAVEVRIKNPVAASQGGDVVMSASTHSINIDSSDIDEDFAVDFVPNRPNASFYRLRGVLHYDTSFSYKDFQDWRIIKMSVKTDSFRVYYEGNLIFRAPRDGRSFIDRIDPYLSFQQGINVQLDWMKLYGTNDELILFEDFNDTANLASHAKSYQCPSPDCITRFTKYFNNQWSETYSPDQIDSLYSASGIALNVCGDSTAPPVFNPALLLCRKNAAIIPVEARNELPCADSLSFAISRGYERYAVYKDSVRGSFTRVFLDKCLRAVMHETFVVHQPVSEYHYTLYYYDQAGNLVKTIPPQGVHPNFDVNWLQHVKQARTENNILVPEHGFITQYRYNTLNQVVQQQTPDAGVSRFWYDRIGRLVLSQNAKQAASFSAGGEGPGVTYSYTLYDHLSRITEAGQLNNAGSEMNNSISRTPVQLQNWMNSNASCKKQVTATFYDQRAGESYLQKDLLPYIMRQSNLRNRVSFSVFTEAGNLNNYDYAVFYNYDIHGNIDTILQDYGSAGVMAQQGNRYKRITYQYDLVSGKINRVSYQPRLYDPVTKQSVIQPDAFYHQYSYDAENRLTDVYTGADETHWDHDAHYRYYKHGPLSRAVIGENQVQGIDYAYTLQGWLKAVNGAFTEENPVSKDAYGFSLHYYGNDYTAINASGAYSGLSTKLEMFNAYKPLFNGNISSMAVNIGRLGAPLLYNYQYDQLNRLTGMDAYKGNTTGKNIWDNGLTVTQEYKESISYDANGNILAYNRNGLGSALAMDNLTYHYQPGNNKLDHVKDRVPASAYPEDIDDQQPGNYAYDETGNLIKDNAGGISKIEWTVYGKIKSVTKTNGETIAYTYDAAGNRISKEVTVPNATTTTFYVRDANGNVMAVYGINNRDNKLLLNEQHLYGSSRLGIFIPAKDLSAMPLKPVNMGYGNSGSLIIFERGKKFFELNNHLGNVLATVSDKKKGHDAGNGTIDYYEADIVSAQDYYPFGMEMPARTFRGGPGGYRYGFNGKENDNDAGEGIQDYGMRIYDRRLGRFLSVDPLTNKYPELTPYQFASNRPIDGVDLDGLEYIAFHHYANGAVAKTKFYKMTDKDIKRLGGTTAGVHYSVPFGPGGRGIVHYAYDAAGNRTDERWEQRQVGGASDFEFHGLYSGGGSVTHDGNPKSTNYNFNEQPIDWADAIAKRHDKDYAAVTSENYATYLEDIRTLQADKDMVNRIDDFISKNWYKIRGMQLDGPEGIDTPVRTTSSTELEGSLYGQRILINALGIYKQWKVENNKSNDDKYKANREAFGKVHPNTALILDNIPAAKKQE